MNWTIYSIDFTGSDGQAYHGEVSGEKYSRRLTATIRPKVKPGRYTNPAYSGVTAGEPVWTGTADQSPDREVFYSVFPRRNWEQYCKTHGGTRGDRWADIADEGAEAFEELMGRNGYEVGSVGGHPTNFDFHKAYDLGDGKVYVSFAWWGNPYHC
jgi:hypothetical protein